MVIRTPWGAVAHLFFSDPPFAPHAIRPTSHFVSSVSIVSSLCGSATYISDGIFSFDFVLLDRFCE